MKGQRRKQRGSKKESDGESTPPTKLQKLPAALHAKAKASPNQRFHARCDKVYRPDVLALAYACGKANGGAAGVDGQTFADIVTDGVERWPGEPANVLIFSMYGLSPVRRVWIPKPDGKPRPLGIPTIRDRVVQTAAMVVLTPIFEADLQPEQYAYRAERSALDAVSHVRKLLKSGHTQGVDADLSGYFDAIPHAELMRCLARRIVDGAMLHLVKMWLVAPVEEIDERGNRPRTTRNKDEGRGTPQGAPISPLLSNLYLNEVDQMLERAKEVTREGRYTHLEYARFADDLVILVDDYRRWDWLVKAVYQRLMEELAKLDVQVNTDKTRLVDRMRGESFGFLGFEFRRVRTLRGKGGVRCGPKMQARTALLRKLKEVFRRHVSQPVHRVITLINPILRGWVNHFRFGHSSRCFGFVCDWVEKKTRRHLMRARKRKGFGWKRWSRDGLYDALGLYADYRVGRTQA